MAGIPNQFGENDSKAPAVDGGSPESVPGRGALLSWVMDKVTYGRQVRDSEHAENWKEFTRLWRGYYTKEDATTNSERSKLISPASQQAVEMTASEIEEATFGREAWFDINDDIRDEERDDAIAYRDQLLEDLELSGAINGLTDTFLMGCIYGTGITKINMEVKNVPQFGDDEITRVYVTTEAVRPDEFVIDPAAKSIEEALYVAHEVIKPRHTVKEKQSRGIYRKGEVGRYSGSTKGNTTGKSDFSVSDRDDSVLVTEYFGKVPAFLLPDAGEEEFGMVEAIVTIANEQTILKAIKSPFTMKDRPIVAYQHDSVPGQFYGRGVIEKGYNPQKALDAELRARVDGLALMTAPMMGADITRMPRNPDLRTRPGKFFLTRGRPSEIIEPVAFNAPGIAATFQNAGDLERMVQMATGAMDTAIPVSSNRRNETVGGMSQMNAAFLKRSKRIMRRIEVYLDTVITKCLWRFMQFDPERYAQDAVFRVNSTMGIMAREVENQQLVQMLGFVPPESPAHKIIVQALFENTNSADKVTLKGAIEEMNKPPTPEERQQQEKMKQIQMAMVEAQLEEQMAKVAKLKAEAMLAEARAQHELIEADLEDDRLEIEAANAATGAEKARQMGNQNAISAAKVLNESKKADKQSGK